MEGDMKRLIDRIKIARGKSENLLDLIEGLEHDKVDLSMDNEPGQLAKELYKRYRAIYEEISDLQ